MSALFDSIADWLLSRALEDADLSETVQLLARRLVEGGIPISRMVIGRFMLHPVIGLYDLTWEAKANLVEVTTVPRAKISSEMIDGSPFGRFTRLDTNHIRADLTDPDKVAQHSVFDDFARDNNTDYAAWSHGFSIEAGQAAGELGIRPGIAVSVCTKRFSGFSDSDIEGFERLLVPLFLSVRMSTERFLARTLLETYLGRNTGNLVLSGQSARGDGETIKCAIFYSDMRNSSQLSQQLHRDDYLAAVNRYFDCTAGAVQDHGGEVLKFVGDGVLAIFPIVPELRPVEAMCAAALSSARESFIRAARLEDAPRFGIAIHVGEIVYGNVGTEDRLDYTATGSAVALVCRCEGLTRTLGAAVIATSQFNALCPEQGTPLGAHEIRGFDTPLELVGYDAVLP